MTTIACDGRSVAGDGQICSGDEICETAFVKVRLINGFIVGLAGDAYTYQRVLSFLEYRLFQDDPFGGATEQFDLKESRFHGLILAPTGECFTMSNEGHFLRATPPCALGTGGEFARGAMEFGALAREAVAVACRCDAKSGGLITEIRL